MIDKGTTYHLDLYVPGPVHGIACQMKRLAFCWPAGEADNGFRLTGRGLGDGSHRVLRDLAVYL